MALDRRNPFSLEAGRRLAPSRKSGSRNARGQDRTGRDPSRNARRGSGSDRARSHREGCDYGFRPCSSSLPEGSRADSLIGTPQGKRRWSQDSRRIPGAAPSPVRLQHSMYMRLPSSTWDFTAPATPGRPPDALTHSTAPLIVMRNTAPDRHDFRVTGSATPACSTYFRTAQCSAM
jgi:hypothetical protein